MLRIYKNGFKPDDNGSIRCETGKYEYFGSHLGERYVMFTYSSPVPVSWEAGDYLVLRGEKFVLSVVPSCKKDARRGTYGAAFVYESVRFDGVVGELKNGLFLDYTPEDNKNHYTGLGDFSFYVEKIKDFTDRIQANLDRRCGKGVWNVVVSDVTDFEPKSISISSGTTMLKAMEMLTSEFEQYFYITSSGGKSTITITGESVVADEFLRYGKGKGLKSVGKTNSVDGVVTRLHVYGSQRNLPYRYYNTRSPYKEIAGEARYMPNLMLPVGFWKNSESGSDVFDVYVDAVSENFASAGIDGHKAPIVYDGGVIVSGAIIEGEVKFDSDNGKWKEIYPSIEGMSMSDFVSGMTVYESGYSKEATIASAIRQWVRRNDKATGKLYNIDEAQEDSKLITSNPVTEGDCSGVISRLMSRGYITVSSRLGISIYAVELASFLNSVTTSDGSVEDNGMSHELTSSEIASITANTNNRAGKLDEFTGISTNYLGESLKDNGVSGDGDKDSGAKDTDGVVMEEAFYITIPQIGFDMMDFVEDNSPMLCVKTGMCAGREFEIRECIAVNTEDYTKGWRLKCARVDDADVNMRFPNSTFVINPGDKFVLTGILMPDVYVEAAQRRLFVQAMKWLAENDHPKTTFTPDVDSKWMEEHKEFSESLTEGMSLKFSDCDEGEDSEIGLEGDGQSVVITQLRIKYGEEALPKYEVTLSDDKKAQNVIERLSEAAKSNRGAIVAERKKSAAEGKEITNLVVSRAGAGSSSVSELDGSVVHIGGVEEIEGIKSFKNGLVVGNIVIANEGDELHISNKNGGFAHFSATGDVVAFGKHEEETGPGSTSYFRELLDVVDAGEPTIDKPYWGWNGTNFGWISGDGKGVANIAWNDLTIKPTQKELTDIIGKYYLTDHQSLAGYATEQWVRDGYQPKGNYQPAGNYLTAITPQMVTDALGFTPYSDANPNGYTSNEGTVTSVALAVPTGFSVSGSPITKSGKITIKFATGYSIPTNKQQEAWDDKWDYNENTIKAVKVNEAVHADTANTADALAQTISIWGQNFNGTQNVDGIISKVGHIYFDERKNDNGENVWSEHFLGRQGNYGSGAGFLFKDDTNRGDYVGIYDWNNEGDVFSYYHGKGSIIPTMYFGVQSIFNGNVGVGTSSPSAKLHVNGNIRVGDAILTYSNGILAFTDANGKPLHITASGDVVAYSGANVEGLNLSLGQLTNVTVNNAVNGQSLVYRDGTWVAETVKSGIESVSWSDIKDKPTNMLGLGSRVAQDIKNNYDAADNVVLATVNDILKGYVTPASLDAYVTKEGINTIDLVSDNTYIRAAFESVEKNYALNSSLDYYLLRSEAKTTYLGINAKAADSAKLNGKSDSAFVHIEGAETITGQKTFSDNTYVNNIYVGNGKTIYENYNGANYNVLDVHPTYGVLSIGWGSARIPSSVLANDNNYGDTIIYGKGIFLRSVEHKADGTFADKNAVRVLSNGYVGINDAYPSHPLHVNGSSRLAGNVTIGRDDSNAAVLSAVTVVGDRNILELNNDKLHVGYGILGKGNTSLYGNNFYFYSHGQSTSVEITQHGLLYAKESARIDGGIVVDGNARLWYDSDTDTFRCNKTIVSDGDLVSFGGIGTIESPTLENLTVKKLNVRSLTVDVDSDNRMAIKSSDRDIVFGADGTVWVDNDFLPTSDYQLGSEDYPWDNVYAVKGNFSEGFRIGDGSHITEFKVEPNSTSSGRLYFTVRTGETQQRYYITCYKTS